MVLAQNPFGQYDPFRLFQQFQQAQQQPDPTSAIASGLGGATRNDPMLGGTAQDQGGDPWGVWKANTRGSVDYGDEGGGGGARGGGFGNTGGWKAPGWDLTQNQYQYDIPAEFRSNQNMYQLGYNEQQDTNRLPFSGGQGGQRNFDRVYAQMNDLAKANGFGDIAQADGAFQQWAANAAIGRLRTDYAKSGADWNTSGFAGYDKYLQGQGQGTPLGNPQQPKPTLQGEFTPAGNQGQRSPMVGTAASSSDTGQGGDMVLPNIMPGPTGNAGSTPAGALGHTAQTSSGLPAMTGQGGNFSLGNFQFEDLDRVIAQAKGNPQLAAQLLRMAKGGSGGAVKTTIGKYMDNYYGKALQAALAQAGNGGQGGSSNPLWDILQGFQGAQAGGTIVPFAQGLAQQAMGADYTGMEDADIQAALAGATALGSLGLGDVAGSRINTQLEDLIAQMNADTFGSDKYDESGRLATLLQGSPYQQAMQRFAQQQQR